MTSHEPTNPRVVLIEHHRRIEELLQRVLAAVRADDRDGAEKLLAKAEKAILTHLDVEEMFVFPALFGSHAAEVEHLRREHATIRHELGEMGLAMDLHVLRASTVEAFCGSLREHAEREESLAYEQAERKLTVNIARAIFDRIKASTIGGRTRARSGVTRIAR